MAYRWVVYVKSMYCNRAITKTSSNWTKCSLAKALTVFSYRWSIVNKTLAHYSTIWPNHSPKHKPNALCYNCWMDWNICTAILSYIVIWKYRIYCWPIVVASKSPISAWHGCFHEPNGKCRRMWWRCGIVHRSYCLQRKCIRRPWICGRRGVFWGNCCCIGHCCPAKRKFNRLKWLLRCWVSILFSWWWDAYCVCLLSFFLVRSNKFTWLTEST